MNHISEEKVLVKELELCNQLGLHARAAAKFVQTAGHYACEVWVTYNDQTVNGKSIMGVMMLAASYGSCLTVQITGEEADKALAALESLLENKFGEE